MGHNYRVIETAMLPTLRCLEEVNRPARRFCGATRVDHGSVRQTGDAISTIQVSS